MRTVQTTKELAMLIFYPRFTKWRGQCRRRTDDEKKVDAFFLNIENGVYTIDIE